jgi:hypothetical protein
MEEIGMNLLDFGMAGLFIIFLIYQDRGQKALLTKMTMKYESLLERMAKHLDEEK